MLVLLAWCGDGNVCADKPDGAHGTISRPNSHREHIQLRGNKLLGSPSLGQGREAYDLVAMKTCGFHDHDKRRRPRPQ
jgi:hypothetical protein